MISQMFYFLKKSKQILAIVIVVNLLLATVVRAETGVGIYQPNNAVIPTVAVDSDSQSFVVTSDQAGGGAAVSLNKNFSLTYVGGILSAADNLTLSVITDRIDLPWNLQKISPIYGFKVVGADKSAKRLSLTLGYDEDSKQFKQVYVFNDAKQIWQAAPTTDYPLDHQVKAVINGSAAMVAVFAKPGTLTVGRASWYKYQGGDFAASPDFAKGSRLRVTNLANGKTIEVTVNDWGPDRAKHPERAIDLDKVAFAKIGDTGDGVIDVAVSPIEIVADVNGRELGVKATGLANQPKITAKAVMIRNENTGEIWLEKNSEAIRPIASLSKVVAMSVYLDLKPNLDDQVTYKDIDEQMNLRYCSSAENTKVSLTDGLKLKAKDLFNAALVASANNAVEALVRNSGVSRTEFVAKMNETATRWGATHTKFVEPTGLSSQNVSSAKDYALIVGEAMKRDAIAKAGIQPSYTFTTADKKKHILKNTNKLITAQAQLNLRAEQYPIISSKTGYLSDAGYCLMTRVRQGNDDYTIVTLGAPTRAASFTDMADLINYLKYNPKQKKVALR